MTTLPLRGLAELGAVTDIDPLILPPNAWTKANNCRFIDGALWRGPLFRAAGTFTKGRPTFVAGYGVPSSPTSYEFLICYADGSIYRWNQRSTTDNPGIETNLSEAAWVPNDYVDESFTFAVEQDIVYINRPDRTLWYCRKVGEAFQPVPGFGAENRCKAIRSLNGQLVAIGFFRSGRTYPTGVRASDFVSYDSAATIWDAAPTNSAAENILGNLGERLIDGCEMRGRMYLFAEHETWWMEQRPDAFIFNYAPGPLFSDRGMISQNCAVTAGDGGMYVFGSDDIWRHDGSTVASLSLGRVNRDIYDYIVRDLKQQFFVTAHRERQEIMFCHVSTHPDCKFKVGAGNVPEGLDDYPGCNRSATYSMRSNTWTFDDLPYVVGASTVSAFTGKRWEEMTEDWADVEGSWLSYGDKTLPSHLFVSPSAYDAVYAPPVAVTDTIPLVLDLANSPHTFPQTYLLNNDTGYQIAVANVAATGSTIGAVSYDTTSHVITYQAPAATIIPGTPGGGAGQSYPNVVSSTFRNAGDDVDWTVSGLTPQLGDVMVLQYATDLPGVLLNDDGPADPAWVLQAQDSDEFFSAKVYSLAVDAPFLARMANASTFLVHTGGGSPMTFPAVAGPPSAYWRIAIQSVGIANSAKFSELRFVDTDGNAFSPTGTPFASDNGYPGLDPTKLFDGDLQTFYSGVNTPPTTIGMHFGSNIAVAGVIITPANDTDVSRAPYTFDLDYSSDGSSWTTLRSFDLGGVGYNASIPRSFMNTTGGTQLISTTRIAGLLEILRYATPQTASSVSLVASAGVRNVRLGSEGAPYTINWPSMTGTKYWSDLALLYRANSTPTGSQNTFPADTVWAAHLNEGTYPTDAETALTVSTDWAAWTNYSVLAIDAAGGGSGTPDQTVYPTNDQFDYTILDFQGRASTATVHLTLLPPGSTSPSIPQGYGTPVVTSSTGIGGIVRAFDLHRAKPNGLYDPGANGDMLVQRRLMAMDSVPDMHELRGYRGIKSVWATGYPVDPAANPISIAWGTTDAVTIPVTYGPALTYDGGYDDQLDNMAFGRYIGMEIRHTGEFGFVLTSLDIGFEKGGDR